MRQLRSKSQRGGAFVEIALVLFPMLLLIYGAMTFSHAVFAYNNVSWIARQASRWAAVRGSSSGNVASTQSIETYALTQAAGLLANSLDVNASFSPNNNPGSAVSVEVSYVVNPLVVHMFVEPFTVRSTSTATILQ